MLTIVSLLFYSSMFIFSETQQLIQGDNKVLPVHQLTFSAKNHELDNNDNFSYDDRYICYDTRGTLGYGIENCTSIEVVEIAIGKEIKIYQPDKIRLGTKPSPGIGAVSFHPQEYSLVFIHGPEIQNLYNPIQIEDIYSKTNRRGCIISLKEDLNIKNKSWVDFRMISCNTKIPTGAHRGGSHRHEYSASGKRIGCTYDDKLLPQYGRTIAYFEETNKFLPNANYYFAVLVKVVPMEKVQEGEFVKALGDSWVDKEGKCRAFIGTIKEGDTFVDYLCVVEIPDNVDIQTSSSGDCQTYPEPPQGLNIYKITKVNCAGIVRASYDGKRIAYLDKDMNGRTQIFIVKKNKHEDKETFQDSVPIQVTFLPYGVEDNLRWHPSGNVLFSISEGAVIAVCVKEGENFGKSVFITPKYKKNKPYALVVSRKGNYLAFNRCVPTYDERGIRLFSSEGKDFSQIFLLECKDNVIDGLYDIK